MILLIVHLACVWIKAQDEEAYLLATHGQVYHDYLKRTGRFLPKMIRRAGREI
jgi:protein-S-isoprenylcysteine O-methyltransferase Ste14